MSHEMKALVDGLRARVETAGRSGLGRIWRYAEGRPHTRLQPDGN